MTLSFFNLAKILSKNGGLVQRQQVANSIRRDREDVKFGSKETADRTMDDLKYIVKHSNRRYITLAQKRLNNLQAIYDRRFNPKPIDANPYLDEGSGSDYRRNLSKSIKNYRRLASNTPSEKHLTDKMRHIEALKRGARNMSLEDSNTAKKGIFSGDARLAKEAARDSVSAMNASRAFHKLGKSLKRTKEKHEKDPNPYSYSPFSPKKLAPHTSEVEQYSKDLKRIGSAPDRAGDRAGLRYFQAMSQEVDPKAIEFVSDELASPGEYKQHVQDLQNFKDMRKRIGSYISSMKADRSRFGRSLKRSSLASSSGVDPKAKRFADDELSDIEW